MDRKFGDKLGLLDLTESEIKRLGECMKDDRFMDLLRDYTMAIANPDNKKKYEEEIAALESERGVDVKFINPTPGHVLKTSKDGSHKCFINICSSEQVGKPVNKPTVQGATKGMQWSIPHSLSQPREDFDKAGGKCTVYDVVFHPDTYHMAEKNTRFRKMIHDMALDAVERLFKVTLDKVNIKKPKMKFKGVPTASMIRTPREGTQVMDVKDPDPNDPLKFPYPPLDSDLFNHSEPKPSKPKPAPTPKPTPPEKEKSEKPPAQPQPQAKPKKKAQEGGNRKKVEHLDLTNYKPGGNNVRSDLLTMMACIDGKTEEYVEPKYTLTHRGYFDMKDYYNLNDHSVMSTRPRELILNIELPMLKAASAIHLEIFEDRVFLECAKPVKYKLSCKLPYAVDDSKGHARFDKSKRRLTITLEVLPPVGQHPYSALMLLQDEKEDACGSCVREQMSKLSGKDTGAEEPTVVEDPAENEFVPSTHPGGLVHGREKCRHTKYGEMWGRTYEEGWEKDIDLGILFNNSPSLIERLTDYQRKEHKYGPHMKERPEITFHQDEAFVSIIVKLKKIDNKELWYIVSPDGLQFSCIAEHTSRRVRSIYQLYIKFNTGEVIDPRRSRVDVSDSNAVFLLRKHISSWHEWQTFCCGFDPNNLKTLTFATEQNINNLLSTVIAEAKKTHAREFECEIISDEENSELLALKLTPNEIIDEERVSVDEENDVSFDDLPTLKRTCDAVHKIQEKKGLNAKIDYDKLVMKAMNQATSESVDDEDTDEDDDSEKYETAESSSDEEIKSGKKEATTNGENKEDKETEEAKAKRAKGENEDKKVETDDDDEESGENEEEKEKTPEEKAADDARMKEIIAKINANTRRKLSQMQEEAARNNERIVFRELRRGGGREEEVSDHRTKSVIVLDNNMLFEIDCD